jgi:hypothetical protein
MNTGSILAGRPALGAWVTYGLGSANRNLPTFVTMLDDKEPVGGPKNWSAGFLPATYQGTQFRQGDTPILHLKPPGGTTDRQQRSKLDFLKELNERYAGENPGDSELEARIGAYELAYQMQSAGPEAVDLTKETEATRRLYGLDDAETATFGTNCLLARRLVERGVRFVELYAGSGSGWDAHVDIEGNHAKRCRASDKPIAGLLADLKSRGMLDDTLVIFGGEFGRTPYAENRDKAKAGRDHHHTAFCTLLAGGGVKGGLAYGASDELGMNAVEHPVHVHDLHATILYLAGLDHERLTYRYAGRDFRLTDVYGKVARAIIA